MLRRITERSIAKPPAGIEASSGESRAQRLVHELDVNQVELELQNEPLRTARAEADFARNQSEDIDQYAPCGCHSLDANGMIVQIDDTELRRLGDSRDEVIGRLKPIDMRERTEFIGGAFSLVSQSGQGTRIEVALSHSRRRAVSRLP